MSIICKGQLKIKCNTCGHIITIDCSELPFDEVERHQKNMGNEICFSADYEFNCPKCNATIKVKYDIWEYPEGQIETDNIDIEGGIVVQKCNCEIEQKE